MYCRLFVAFFWVLFCSSLVEAQEFRISEDVSIRNDRFYTVLGKVKDRYLVFRDRSNKFEIQAYNMDLQKTWDKEIELEKRPPEILQVIPLDEFFYVVYKYRKKGRTIVKANKYDSASNLKDTATVIDYGQRFITPNPALIESEDRSSIIIYQYEQNSLIELTSFSLRDMNTRWENKVDIGNISLFREYQEILVSNEGDFYYIVEKNNRKSEIENHRFEIVSISNEHEDQVSKIIISADELLTYDVAFVLDNHNKNLVAGGFYSDKNKGRTNGFFYLNIPLNGTDSFTLEATPFNDDFVVNLLGKDIDKIKGVTDLQVQDIVLRRDGGILLIAERKRTYERRSASGRYVRSDYVPYIVDYYYDDLCLISVHPDGKMHWETILHKKQYSQDDDASYSSYFLYKSPSNLRFLFNDEIHEGNTVSEYVVKANGSADRNSLLSTANKEIKLRFRDGIQIGPREMLIPSERRNKLRLVHITYD